MHVYIMPLLNSGFLHKVSSLAIGTGLAQFITILASPIISRIYTPEEFGIFSIYASAIGIMSILVNARYEIAIVQPRKDTDAQLIALLCLFICSIFSISVFVVVVFFRKFIIQQSNTLDLGIWFYVMPASLLIVGFQQTLSYLFTRASNFQALGFAAVLQSITNICLQIGINIIHPKWVGGLILGNIFGQLISVIYLLALYLQKEDQLSGIKLFHIISIAKKYKRIPIYSIPGGILNILATELPLFYIMKFFGAASTGTYGMANKVVNLPFSLMSAAVYKVFFQEVTTIKRNQPKQLLRYVVRIFLVLLALTTLPVLAMLFWGKDIFGLILGNNWQLAGSYASLLVISLAIKFAVSPLSAILALEDNISKGFYWQVLYFLTLSITLACLSGSNILMFLKVLVIHDVLLYFIQLIFTVNASRYVD